MAARTISAYADERTARDVERIAQSEDRSPAQIAAAALRFYVRLPAEAHAALRRLEKLGTDRDMDDLAREIGRKALDAEWDVAHRQLVTEMKVGDAPVDEDGILTEAVRLVHR
ncbi:MAG: hypothetical protein HQL40_21560 [Alphaproteobacteria bacterium]|nr:hypothetical protein [Alphaproteobacteria bacterium]MBF0336187.1 hypothetical protein [Alphaproteobacteria bacterium]